MNNNQQYYEDDGFCNNEGYGFYNEQDQCWDQGQEMNHHHQQQPVPNIHCERCGRFSDHTTRDCRATTNILGKIIKLEQCTNCGLYGHQWKKCTTKRFFCTTCGKAGHNSSPSRPCGEIVAVNGIPISVLHTFCNVHKVFGPHDGCNINVSTVNNNNKRMREDGCMGRPMQRPPMGRPMQRPPMGMPMQRPPMGGNMGMDHRRPMGVDMSHMDIGPSQFEMDMRRDSFNVSNTWKNRSSGSSSWGMQQSCFEPIVSKKSEQEIEEKELGEITGKEVAKDDESGGDSSSGSDSDSSCGSDSDSSSGSDSDSESSDDEEEKDEVVCEKPVEPTEDDQLDFDSIEEDEEGMY